MNIEEFILENKINFQVVISNNQKIIVILKNLEGKESKNSGILHSLSFDIESEDFLNTSQIKQEKINNILEKMYQKLKRFDLLVKDAYKNTRTEYETQNISYQDLNEEHIITNQIYDQIINEIQKEQTKKITLYDSLIDNINKDFNNNNNSPYETIITAIKQKDDINQDLEMNNKELKEENQELKKEKELMILKIQDLKTMLKNQSLETLQKELEILSNVLSK